jgi:hypothetical protein
MSIGEFIKLRENIESIIVEIESLINRKSIANSYKKLEESNEMLTKLKQLAENEIQNRAVLRLTSELEYLAGQIDKLLSKREAGKKEDGNIAFKCNWNDRYYKAPCSLTVYNYNILQGRAWCSSPLNKCREFKDEVNLENHPCYESIALKEMYFGAGWDHTGERKQPRHIHSARIGRMAILTTRPPGTDEAERIIIGCLFIKSVIDDPDKETMIYGDRTKSIEIYYDAVKIKFWDYYKNAGDENLILWASGLFRYISDETVLNILKGIGEQYKNTGREVSNIIELIRHYDDLLSKKRKLH